MINKIKAYGIALYIKKNNSTKLLLCKSINSNTKWGFLKGVEDDNDLTPKQTAQREFEEESGIYIQQNLLTKYFYQENEDKDIGIYLVNASKLDYINKFFKNDYLLEKYLCDENEIVKLFDIHNLPPFKKKQIKLLSHIIDYLEKDIL
ncbi:MAG: NUDIX domain-containing protein [Campylobacteraceae bacterium]|jgi:ADP-ribose pyrophosphatase YjhB (NUDIX family)|nr:NUDIX domain-containing protein [Campylobacteraceae bacterium]MBT4571901.1 NUDIX domain-containing protein [Campylobacteraceae bacterium]MBT7118166.1 NUDIX domain-containing protein [Campylobacteraceae bacterium]